MEDQPGPAIGDQVGDAAIGREDAALEDVAARGELERRKIDLVGSRFRDEHGLRARGQGEFHFMQDAGQAEFEAGFEQRDVGFFRGGHAGAGQIGRRDRIGHQF